MKALFVKQIKEMIFPLIKNGKTGGVRNRAATIALMCLMGFAYLSLGASFFAFSVTMVTAFSGGEYAFIPFAVMGVLAFLLALFVSGFYANGVLYSAKDNELLLSMPLSPAKILFVRISSIFFNALIMSALVLVPTGLSWVVFTAPGPALALYCIIGIIVFALAVTGVSCVLGFIIAFITSRVKRKNVMQVALTVIFLGAYYYFYFNVRKIIESITENGAAVAEKMKTYGFFFYAYGKACTGDIFYIIGFTTLTVGFFALVYCILSKSFFAVTAGEKPSLVKKPVKKTAPLKTKELTFAAAGIKKALLRRELLRFVSTPAYVINTGFGCLMMIAGAVALVIFKKDINTALAVLESGAPAFLAGRVDDAARLLAVLLNLLISSTVYYTAPSVSLEGKNFWILRSSPLPAADILNAKQSAHLLIAGIPAVLLSAAASYVLRTGVTGAVFQALLCLAYVLLFSAAGLWLNVKIPDFNWTDEAVPVKQGAPVMISLFGGLLISVIIIAACFALSLHTNLDYIFLGGAVLMIAAARLINGYLTKNGERLLLEM